MACNFCHNEGTPVASAYVGDMDNLRKTYLCGRVSVFQESNGVDFLPGTMQPDRKFEKALQAMSLAIGCNELHLTGGEPSLHSKLPEIIESANSAGYSVKMTSNGENVEDRIRKCAQVGLKKVNFSIFGTTPTELAAVQIPRRSDVLLADLRLRNLRRSIDSALESGVGVDANIVMTDFSHADRVLRIMDEYDDKVSVRILNDLSAGDQSYIDIYELLSQIGAVPKELSVEAGSSNSRVKYELPNGREIYFKQIRRTILPKVCSGCNFNNDNDCKEGYYGTRLYIDNKGKYKVGVCLQRMDLTVDLDEFLASDIPDEIIKFRDAEYSLLKDHYKDRLKLQE
jgi:cyclic pyranopterin phosphate synthase